MDKLEQNKELVLEYFDAISGKVKTVENIDRYVDDHELKEHIMFFDTIFPKYELHADEVTAEKNRVVVLARLKGRHEGELNGIPPTYREVDFKFAIGYIVDRNKIVDHWMIADQAALMEQLEIKAEV
ncbi:ester cyclase [Portibacter marinus]|uniref:ester cyclase n=1 Tax=Portibacter marinus TaxID=2898660 RepID=UPI001F1EA0FE|nr:ester cyclase [Portibacter marinus]